MRRDLKISVYHIACICIVFIGIYAVYPPLEGYMGSMGIFLSILCNFILLLIALKKQFYCFENKLQIFFVLFIVIYMTVVPYLLGNGVWSNRYLELLIFITAPLMFNMFTKIGKIEMLKKSIIVVLFFTLITWAITTVNLIGSPYLSRSIKSGGEVSVLLKQSGIGGYEFIYFCVILCVLSFYVFWQKKSIKYLCATIMMLLIIVLSNYMMALLLALIGFILTIIQSKKNTYKILSIVVIILLILCLDGIAEVITNVVYYLTPNGRIAKLLASGRGDLITTVLEEFVIDRLPTLESSMIMIRETFGIGAVFRPSQEVILTLGQHSHLLDSIALWGIVVGAMYIYVLMRPLKVNASIYIVFLGVLLFNNATMSLAFAVYIIVPFCELYLLSEKRIGEFV